MPLARRYIVLLGLGSLLALWAGPHLAFAKARKSPVFAEFPSKLALDGHDAVAYFKTGKPVKGAAEHSLSWNGASWRFASAENKAAFAATPQAFAPQYGGYCAWAVSQGYTAKGRPQPLAHRRRQALPQLQRFRAEGLG